MVRNFLLSMTRLEKDGFAMQNANLPGDGLRVRVRADRGSDVGIIISKKRTVITVL